MDIKLQNLAFVLIIFLLLMPNGLFAQQASDSTVINIEDILLRTSHPYASSRVSHLQVYSKVHKISVRSLEQILDSFVSSSCPSRKVNPEGRVKDYIICTNALDVLGDLGTEESIPVLRAASQTENRAVRLSAVRSAAKIGGDSFVTFAKEVIKNNDTYGYLDRRKIYESLLPLVSTDEFPRTRMFSDTSVVEFLTTAILTDAHPGNVIFVDKVLKKARENYRNSTGRKSMLQNFSDIDTGGRFRYFTKELNASDRP